MAEYLQPDFNRTALTIQSGRVCYTGQRADRVPGGLLGLIGTNIITLDLSFNELTSLSGIKDFINLRELILDNNQLRNLNTLPKIPTLTTLSLNNNKLTDMDTVFEKIKECCPNLIYASLLGNPGCPDQLTDPLLNDEDDYERYRLYALHVLPQSLRFLDSRGVTLQERIDSRNRGRYSRTIKFMISESTTNNNTQTNDDALDKIFSNINYTPLPRSVRTPNDHKGAYGKCKYRYSGKNSEGNRFILNNDL